MNSFIIFKIIFFVDLYIQLGEYQVEAKAKVSSRSLANDVDSAEKLNNLPFVNEVLHPKTTESASYDDSRYLPQAKYWKGKFRTKKTHRFDKDSEPKRKLKVKKHKKKNKRKVAKFSKTFSQDNSSQSASIERRKPFDIVVHIKVNE